MSQIIRLLRIIKIVAYYRLDEFIPNNIMPRLLSALLKISPWKIAPSSTLDRGTRLRRGLEELGPVFVKFGQALSTRRDVLPEDIADELVKLVDDVPPFSEDEAVSIVEKALGGNTSEFFMQFNKFPLASASVAQVHSATLHNGKAVVVKIIRPQIHEIIRQDISLLFVLAKLIENSFKDGPRLRLLEIVSDYETTIMAELDLAREAANANQLRRNFQNRNMIYVPEVFWEYTSKNVYVMERISGVPINDIETLKSSNIDLRLLAEKGVEIFFTQVFKDNFFHADMHPGNIFVDVSKPENPTYISIDCAIIGTLSEKDQYYLGRNLLSMFKRDYRDVALLHLESGWIADTANINEFESTIRTLCEPIFERPIKEISLGQLLVNLFKAARRYNMEVQPSLVLLQKTLLNIEGLGRQLYPDLNLWHTALPFLENWIRERYSPVSIFHRLQRKMPSWIEQFPESAYATSSNFLEGTELRNEPRIFDREVEDLRREIEAVKSSRKLLSFIFLFVIVSVCVLILINPSLISPIPLFIFD